MLAELTCKPVEIGDYAWIGAGATVLPGVRVGRHAVVGAASVITKDVPDGALAIERGQEVIKDGYAARKLARHLEKGKKFN